MARVLPPDLASLDVLNRQCHRRALPACAFLARVLRIARASLDRVLSKTAAASLRSYTMCPMIVWTGTPRKPSRDGRLRRTSFKFKGAVTLPQDKLAKRGWFNSLHMLAFTKLWILITRPGRGHQELREDEMNPLRQDSREGQLRLHQ